MNPFVGQSQHEVKTLKMRRTDPSSFCNKSIITQVKHFSSSEQHLFIISISFSAFSEIVSLL